MPTNPTSAELEAIEDSKQLVKYAAEHKSGLKPQTVTTLEETWAIAQSENSNWDPETAAKFWLAFADLCACVDPVTVDSIYSNVPTIPRAQWRPKYFGARPITSLSERTARRYLALLFALLFSSIFLWFVTNSASDTATLVSKELSDQISNVSALKSEIRKYQNAYQNVASSPATSKFPLIGPLDQLTSIDEMEELGTKIDQAVNAADEDISLQQWTFGPLLFAFEGHKNPPEVLATRPPAPFDYIDSSIGDLRSTLTNFYARQSVITRTLPQISFIVKIANYALLPILLGTMGACAYVIRKRCSAPTLPIVWPIGHDACWVVGSCVIYGRH